MFRKKCKTIVVIAIMSAMTLSPLRVSAAALLAQRGRTRITPNKLTITYADDSHAPITIDTFRVFGYNVAQLRTITAALGGTVNALPNNEFQVVSAGKAVAFNPVRFSVPQEVDYIINQTTFRNAAGQQFYPNTPGLVYLSQFQYNWASVRDVASMLNLTFVNIVDDPANNSTLVIIGQPATTTTLTTTSTTTTYYNGSQNGWAPAYPPGSGVYWNVRSNYPAYPPYATTTVTTTSSTTTTDACTVSCEVEADQLAWEKADAYADNIAWNGAGSLPDSPERGAIYRASYQLIYDYAYALYEGYGEEIANSAADNLANSAAWDGAQLMIDEIIDGFGDGQTTFQDLIYGMIFHLHYDTVIDVYNEEELARLMSECEYHNPIE